MEENLFTKYRGVPDSIIKAITEKYCFLSTRYRKQAEVNYHSKRYTTAIKDFEKAIKYFSKTVKSNIVKKTLTTDANFKYNFYKGTLSKEEFIKDYVDTNIKKEEIQNIIK